MSYKISKREMAKFEKSWNAIKSTRDLRQKSRIAAEIDAGKTPKTEEQHKAELAEKKRHKRNTDVDRDRKAFASWLMTAYGLDVEDLARMYDRQGRKCACWRKISLSSDYAIFRDRIICKSCYSDVE